MFIFTVLKFLRPPLLTPTQQFLLIAEFKILYNCNPAKQGLLRNFLRNITIIELLLSNYRGLTADNQILNN